MCVYVSSEVEAFHTRNPWLQDFKDPAPCYFCWIAPYMCCVIPWMLSGVNGAWVSLQQIEPLHAICCHFSLPSMSNPYRIPDSSRHYHWDDRFSIRLCLTSNNISNTAILIWFITCTVWHPPFSSWCVTLFGIRRKSVSDRCVVVH